MCLRYRDVTQRDMGRLKELAGRSFVNFRMMKARLCTWEEELLQEEGSPSLSACQTTPGILHPHPTLLQYKKDVNKLEQVQHNATTMARGCNTALWQRLSKLGLFCLMAACTCLLAGYQEGGKTMANGHKWK